MDLNALTTLDLSAFLSSLPAVGTLILLIISDIFTGALAAGSEGKLSSKISFAGISRKVGELFAVALAEILKPYSAGLPLAQLVPLLFIYNEALSNLENLKRLGVIIPFLNAWIAIQAKKVSEQGDAVVKEAGQVEPPAQKESK